MSQDTDLATRDQSAGAIAGFESRQIAGHEAGTHSIVAREESEMKAAIALARHFPRDESQAYTAIIKSTQRPSFAENCVYSFPRGGQRIEGPSVDLAREAARCWGNIRYGLRVVSEDEERVHIKGYAYDAQTNTYAETEDKFGKKVQRKTQNGTQWVTPDERDLRELVNRRGAICVRNAILQLIPPDIIEDAVRQAKTTMEKAASGEVPQDRTSAIRRLVLGFSTLGVSAEMIANRLGHATSLITNEEIVELRGIYKSIADGNSRREEHFDFGAEKTAADPQAPRRKSEAEKKTPPAAAEAAPPVAEQAPQSGEPDAHGKLIIMLMETYDIDQELAISTLDKAVKPMFQKRTTFLQAPVGSLEAIERKIRNGEIKPVKAAE